MPTAENTMEKLDWIMARLHGPNCPPLYMVMAEANRHFAPPRPMRPRCNNRPMLAATLRSDDLADIPYPMFVQIKYNGIRCIVRDGVALSRAMKPIPNEYIQESVRRHADALEGCDGELVVGTPTDASVFRLTQSGVMSRDGCPDFTFHVFDMLNMPAASYDTRLDALARQIASVPFARTVETIEVDDEDELLAFYSDRIAECHEGIMLREPSSPYKHGRVTLNEASLMKMKPCHLSCSASRF